jgi:hypothetical protein
MAHLCSASTQRRSHICLRRVQEKPVLQCHVEAMKEEEVPAGALAEEAERARQLFRDVVRMHAQLEKVPVDDALLVRRPSAPA